MYVLKKMLRRWIFNLRNWKRKPRLPYVILIKHFQTAPHRVSLLLSSIYQSQIHKNSLIIIRIKNYSQNLLHNVRRSYQEYHFISIIPFQCIRSIDAYASEKMFLKKKSQIFF